MKAQEIQLMDTVNQSRDKLMQMKEEECQGWQLRPKNLKIVRLSLGNEDGKIAYLTLAMDW